jgi:KDO2-lipid IV(A) lauroyltransferase
MRVVPPGVAYGAARLAGSLGFVVARQRRRALLSNMRWLQPSLAPAARVARARKTLVNFFQAAADLFRLPSLSRSELDRLVALRGREHLQSAMAHGKGAIVVTSHLGPYELGAAVLAVQGHQAYAMAEDFDPETNKALAQYRQATGLTLVSRNFGLRSMYRLLAQGNLLFLVGDRVVGPGTEGIEVEFGAGRRRVPSGPAALAIATGAPIVVGHITRTRQRIPRYEILLEPPILPPPRAPNATRELTVRVGARLAATVTAHPDQWFVFQPEWTTGDGAI